MSDPLIDNLCKDLKPARPLWHPACCMGTWVLIALIIGGSIMIAYGLRGDIGTIMRDPVFAFEMVLMIALAVSALVASFWMRIPDMRDKTWILPIPFTLFGVYCAWAVIYMINARSMPPMHVHHCMVDGFVITAVPAILMFLMVARGCTTRPIMMASMNALAITAIGYIALRLTCVSDDIGHIIFTHLLPFIVVGGGVGMLARTLYRW